MPIKVVLTKFKTFANIRECFRKTNSCKRKKNLLKSLYPSLVTGFVFVFLSSIDQTPLGIFRAIFHVRTWND